MKKLIIIIVLLFSTLFNGSLTSAATAEYDHNELLDYPGYGEAMYESIVEQTTFISGRYTANKDYVNESINQITDYAKGWWNEYERISNLPPKEKIREMINAGGGYLLTVGDFVKNLFTDYDEHENDSTVIDGQYFVTNVTSTGNYNFTMKDGYKIVFSNGFEIPEGMTFHFNLGKVGQSAFGIAKISADVFGNGSSSEIGPTITVPYKDFTNFWKNYTINRESFYSATGTLKQYFPGFGYTFKKMDDSLARPKSPLGHMTDYVKDKPVSMVTPQPKAYLSCPDGTRINMAIDGGTFLDVNGQVMQVSKDGTATVDSQLCTLGWEKPVIQYIDDTEQVGITTPDGKIIDAETGEPIDGEFDEEIPDDCGLVCAIGKFMGGLGQIAKSIAGLATKILDGLLALFVPDDLDFVSQEFEKMTGKLNEKFSILKGLKDSITNVFDSGDSGNPLSEVNLSLPAAPDQNFSLDTVSFIEPFVPRVRQIISGILFLMTIIYVYRKITGRGGVMEK